MGPTKRNSLKEYTKRKHDVANEMEDQKAVQKSVEEINMPQKEMEKFT